MGAFILYDNNRVDELDIQSVQSTFSNKGFADPMRVSLGKYELLLYKKQLVDVENFYCRENNALYAIGTIVYKSLGYRDTLKKLLEDYIQNNIRYDQIIGSYCLIFHVNNRIEIINDALNVCELFTDRDERFITSSFLASANALSKLTINRNASIEKLLTGYIVGEDTLFQQIKRIIPVSYHGKMNIHKWDPINVPKPEGNRKKCIKGRTDYIAQYMRSIQNLAEEFKAELGLSGGYDSRLIFAAAQKTWPFKLDIHTHSTEGVHIHDIEKEIVKEIANKTETKISIIPTRNLDQYSGEEIESILKDGYFYFDGRCAYNMGAFSPTYTRKYKIDTVSDHYLTLNGLGGEVYRNYYMNIKPIVSIKQWMKAKVYPDSVDYVIDRNTFKNIHKYICRKMQNNLTFRWKGIAKPFDIKRYYSEMRMPDCNGLNCNANNQMEFYLTPFIEKATIEDAYRARKFIGVSGCFQAEMITALSPQIAAYKTHYGFTFDKKEPIKYKVYMFIRGILPDSIWNLRVNRLIKKNYQTNGNRVFFERVKDRCDFLGNATKYTEKLFPEICFDYLRTDYAMMPNSSYISIVFYMLKDRIINEG